MFCLVLGNHFIFDFFGPFSASNALEQDFGTEAIHVHQPIETPHLPVGSWGGAVSTKWLATNSILVNILLLDVAYLVQVMLLPILMRIGMRLHGFPTISSCKVGISGQPSWLLNVSQLRAGR